MEPNCERAKEEPEFEAGLVRKSSSSVAGWAP